MCVSLFLVYDIGLNAHTQAVQDDIQIFKAVPVCYLTTHPNHKAADMTSWQWNAYFQQIQ